LTGHLVKSEEEEGGWAAAVADRGPLNGHMVTGKEVADEKGEGGQQEQQGGQPLTCTIQLAVLCAPLTCSRTTPGPGSCTSCC
jgi:hypothetical protein